MNLFKHYSNIVILVLLFRVIRPGAATGSRVEVHEVNESPSCNAKATAMYSTIISAPCTVNAECVQESGPNGSNSLYNFCDYDQQTYLKHAYSDTAYVLVENYDDMKCNKLASIDVFRADGKSQLPAAGCSGNKRHC
ncbi:hypothetical protein GN244_ATG09934 [Phytophthora infestans]|uniref:Secreted protein n=1 Tax=Phytophthora infestans TaxID=4787 RepID=A0A833T5X1_PHYIN|nr:hypothetical protein GN244_ATG09934 [Phytophthora infestans]